MRRTRMRWCLRTALSAALSIMLTTVCVILLLTAPTVSLQASDDARGGNQQTADQRSRWRETLRFGIESDVIELLGELKDNHEVELADEVLELLREGTNPRLLTAGLEYFAEIEDPAAEETAVRLIEDAREAGENTVLHALRYLANSVDNPSQETIVSVRKMLDSRNERVVARAALTLGSFGDVDSIPDLRRAFEQHTEQSVRGDAILGIGRMGERAGEAAEWILPLVTDATLSNTVRYYAVDTLGQIGAEEARDELVALLEQSDGMMRAYAISSLVMLGAGGIERELTRALRDDNWRVRRIALEGVGDGGHTDSYEAVRYMARRDPDHRVRTTAIETIGELNVPDGYDFLRELVSSQNVPFETRAKAVDILVEHDLGDSFETFAEVIEQQGGRSSANRIVHHIGGALARVEHGGLEELYKAFLDHEDVTMRLFAIQGIGRNGFSQFREEIEELADESQPASVRRHAREALDRM